MAPVTSMFVMCLPGLARVVRGQLHELPGIKPTDNGFDGRADVLLFEADRGARNAVTGLRTIEDVFVQIGRADRRKPDSPQQIASMVWQAERVQRALSIWAEQKHPLAGSMTFRVIARLLSEKAFLRTELRHQLTETIRQNRPRWKVADPAQLEIWICEYRAGAFVCGLRLSDVRMRQHDGRNIERQGALRATLAAAMVNLAGKPSGILLDPCCGSGTILAEAAEVGWTAAGTDIDASAVSIASRNVPEASVQIGDARQISLVDGSVRACVSNLPFGRQYHVPGNVTAWLTTVLGEAARVTSPGGHIVLLAPGVPRSALPASVTLAGRFPIRLLGVKTTTWHYQRH
jgi:23S rRNA G2445 N2-methylase RlmL